MIAAEDMTGRNGLLVKALPHDKLIKIIKDYKRLR
jgi:hypothetical protein